METNKTLAEDFGGKRVVSNGYEGFMEGLLQLVNGKEIEEILGEKAHGDEIECYYIYKNYLDLQEANCKFHSPYRKILY